MATSERENAGMKILSKNLLILASAGSGKTFQLANRIIGLVALGVAPEKIVALTFTRKAAGEFADSVLTKLAKAASDPKAAAGLRDGLSLDDVDFSAVLERVVRSLPGLTLGTLDSFFARVVRGFQYELGLTGGKFTLLEGARAAAATDEILAALLGEALDNETGDDFLRAFQRANFGKEEQGVLKGLRDFVDRWQSRYRAALEVEWGPQALAGVRVEDWEQQKNGLAGIVMGGLDAVTFTRSDQRKLLETALDTLQAHTIGSGSLNQASALLGRILEAWQSESGPVELKHHKEFSVGGPAGDALRRLARLAARCEMAAAVERTRAVRDMIAVYDARRETQLRGRGLLGFDDVKILMGAWAKNEDARIWREGVDYRLGARHEHWLLDEFQDTSRGEWTGLLPLIDEAAAGDGEGTVFIVGDRKQAIYGWRGGDVGLFDDVIGRYENLNVEPMAESWRSSPEVLALVNKVFGDSATMNGLFGPDAAAKWQWDPHVSSKPLADPAMRGEARVEVVEDKWEGRLERLESLLEELGIGQRNLSCGILVRSNTLVAEIATELRAKGFDVIEEGQREPSKDNPVGVAIGHLLKWLANPDDNFAAGVLAMSPFATSLRAEFGEHWQRTWEELTARAAASGFAEMIAHVIQQHWTTWSDFGKRRAGDIMTALAEFDAQGGTSPREAADWIERLQVSQSPGSAAVQVMTIHKAKGLGFDVVILPEIPNKATPESQRFTVAEGEGWISQTPPQWARSWVPEMREAEASWSAVQRHQDFCMLYVALTRAKRGLYILLDKPSKSQPEDKASLANWLASSIRSTGEVGVVYQSGSSDWIDNVRNETKAREIASAPRLATGTPRRERKTPSIAKSKAGPPIARSPGGMKFGTAVHEAFECVAWIDESAPKLPPGEGGETVRKLLNVPAIRAIFERKGRNVTCLREQAVDAVLDGAWLSGVIDRLHLHRDGKAVTRVEIIDFKSDFVDDLSTLNARYGPQMQAYREVMQGAYPAATVDCVLVSTHLGTVTAI